MTTNDTTTERTPLERFVEPFEAAEALAVLLQRSEQLEAGTTATLARLLERALETARTSAVSA